MSSDEYKNEKQYRNEGRFHKKARKDQDDDSNEKKIIHNHITNNYV